MFEKPNLKPGDIEGNLEKETIHKIEKILKQLRKYDYASGMFYADLLYPELLPEERTAFEKKWQDVDIVALDHEDSQFKKYLEEKNQLNKKLGEFIKEKSSSEILERAQDLFNKHLQKGALATKVDDIIREYHKAYEIARLLLTKDFMKKASQGCLDTLWHRIQELDAGNPRKGQLINGILGLESWFRDVNINLSKSPEKAGKILAYMLSVRSLTNAEKKKLFNMLVATRAIKGGNGKIKITIVGLEALRQAAKEEIQKLAAVVEGERLIETANFLEKRGILSLDKDADFFDALTEPKPSRKISEK